MNSSFGKTIWNVSSKIIQITQWLFYITCIGIYILIIIQGKFNLNQGAYLLELICGILLAIGAITELLTMLAPIWLQITCLSLITYFYYTYAYKFLSSFNLGSDPKFVWTFPDVITNLIGFKVQGKVIDLIFWLGFVYLASMLLLVIKSLILHTLSKFNVDFASEIKEKDMKKFEKEIKGEKEKYKPASPKQKRNIIIISIIFTILCFAGGIYLGTLEEKKYPTVWKNKFPCTSVLLINSSVGKKGTLDPSCIQPGTPTTVNFTLSDVESKKMLLEVVIWPQIELPDPKFSIEIKLKDPDKKTLLYISKDKLFTGTYNPQRVTQIKKKFYFTASKSGEYTMEVTPYDYYISSILVSIHHIPVTVFKDGQEFAKFEATRGDCDVYQKQWCNADYAINKTFPKGNYSTKIEEARQCLKPGGTGTVHLYGSEATSAATEEVAEEETPKVLDESIVNCTGSCTKSIVITSIVTLFISFLIFTFIFKKK